MAGASQGGNRGGPVGSGSLRNRRHPVLQSAESQMLKTLTSHRGAGDFNTVPGGWPDPDGFLPEARTGAREAAASMKDLAERFAELRNAIMRLSGNPSSRRTRRAPPSASPFGEHDHEREGQSRRRHHRHHGRKRRGPLTTRTTVAGHNRATGYRCAMPLNSPACPDHHAREVEDGKEKGDAHKGKESSHRAVSQSHKPEMQNVRSHS